MLVAAKKPRKKTCKACREVFTPERSLQSVCSPKCGLALAAAKRERAEVSGEDRAPRDPCGQGTLQDPFGPYA